MKTETLKFWWTYDSNLIEFQNMYEFIFCSMKNVFEAKYQV